MMVLMVSTALASLALGVTLAYGLCSALFAIFRMHVRTHATTSFQVQTKPAST